MSSGSGTSLALHILSYRVIIAYDSQRPLLPTQYIVWIKLHHEDLQCIVSHHRECLSADDAAQP